MFHLDVFPIPKSTFENILKKFMSIIVEDFGQTVLWDATLKALFHIGSFVQKYSESEKAMSYRSFVVDKIMEMLSLDDIALPFSLKVEALYDIGMTGMKNMLTILQAMEGAIFTNLSEVCVCLYSNFIILSVVQGIMEYVISLLESFWAYFVTACFLFLI